MAITATVLDDDVRAYSDRNEVTFLPTANTLVLLFLTSTINDPTSVTSSHGTWVDLTSALDNDASPYLGSVFGLISSGSPSSATLTALYSTSGKRACYAVEFPGTSVVSLADAMPASNRKSRAEYIGGSDEDVEVTMNAFASPTNATVVFTFPTDGTDEATATGFTDLSVGGDYGKVFFKSTEDNSPTVNCKVNYSQSRTFAFELVEGVGGGGVTVAADQATCKPGDTVTWTEDFTGTVTSAKLIDSEGNEFSLTGLVDNLDGTGEATIPAMSHGLAACLFEDGLQLSLSDGTDTAFDTIDYTPPTGYTLTTLTSVPGVTDETDWVHDFDVAAVAGDQSIENDSSIVHEVDGSTTISGPTTYTYYTVDATDGVISEIVKTFLSSGTDVIGRFPKIFGALATRFPSRFPTIFGEDK